MGMQEIQIFKLGRNQNETFFFKYHQIKQYNSHMCVFTCIVMAVTKFRIKQENKTPERDHERQGKLIEALLILLLVVGCVTLIIVHALLLLIDGGGFIDQGDIILKFLHVSQQGFWFVGITSGSGSLID